MARIFMAGAEDGSLGAFNYTYSSPTADTGQKRTGSYSYKLDNGEAVGRYLPSSSLETYTRVAVYPTGTYHGDFGSSSGNIVCFCNTDAIAHIKFGLDGTNVPRLQAGNAWLGTYLASASGVTVPLNAWSLLEVYVKIHVSTGVFQAKLNGVTIITYNGNTQLAASGPADMGLVLFGRYWYGNYTGGMTCGYYDDIAINDTTGSVNNSWIGQGGVYLVPVVGAGAVNAMTPSAGSDNYALVDEIPASDTDYVSSADNTAIDLYATDNSALPVTGTVSAVRLGYRAKVTDGGATLVPVIRSEDTTEAQTASELTLSGTFAVKSVNYDVDPIDDAAWTLSKLAALQIGQRKG